LSRSVDQSIVFGVARWKLRQKTSPTLLLLSLDFSKPDALAVIDVKPGSPTFSQIVHTVTMVDLRTIPKTGALLDQKIATLPAERAGGSMCWSAANCPGAARWK
jgi:hypothetical protein